MTYTEEIAAAFGFRDRVLGIDSGERQSTLSRFQGAEDAGALERAYHAGLAEADHYANNCWKWGASTRPGPAVEHNLDGGQGAPHPRAGAAA